MGENNNYINLEYYPFTELFNDKTSGNKKIKQSDYIVTGKIPIIDQGQKLIGGYSNDITCLANVNLPCIIFGDHTRIFKYIDFPFAIGADGVKILVPIKDICVKYVYYFLNQVKLAGKIGYNRNFKYLKEVKIPLPDLPTQIRIDTELEKVDKAREKRRKALALTDQYLQSAFLDMFGDPVRNEKGWEVKKLEDLCEQISDCPHSTPIHQDNQTNYPCIRTTDMKDGYIVWDRMKYVDYKSYLERTKRLTPETGDIVFAREGNFGEAVRIPSEFNFCLGQRTLLFRPKLETCNSEFLWYLIRSDGIYLQAKNNTSGSTVSHINVKDMKKFEGYCPPRYLQQQFASLVEKTEKLRARQKESEKQLDALFTSLMQKYFG